MTTAPKTLTVQDLSGAVRSAVAKIKLPATSGPFLFINPGVICGLIYAGKLTELREADQIAATIAKQVSDHIGVSVKPVVQEISAKTATKFGSKLRPGHIIMGYIAVPEALINFGF